MPHVTNFTYSEGSLHESTPNGQRLHVVSPINILTPMFIPGTLTFSITFGLLEVDTDKDHILQMKFLEKEGETSAIIDTGEMPVPKNTNPELVDLPPEMHGMMMNFNFQNVVLRNEGVYKTEIYFDRELLGEFFIHVKGKEKLK